MSICIRSFQHPGRLLQAVLPVMLNKMNISEKPITDYSNVQKTPKMEKLLRREHNKRRSSERMRVQTAAIETLNLNQAALRKRVTRAVSKLVRKVVYSDELLSKQVAITDVRVPISLTEVLITWQPREVVLQRGVVQTLKGVISSAEKEKLEVCLKEKAREIHNILVGSATSTNDAFEEDSRQSSATGSGDANSLEDYAIAEENQGAVIRLEKLDKVAFVCHDPLERVMLMERTFEALKRMGQTQSELADSGAVSLQSPVTQHLQTNGNASEKKDKDSLRPTDVSSRSSKVYELDRESLIREIEHERKRLAKAQSSWRSTASVTDQNSNQEPIRAAVVTDSQLDDAKQRVRSALRNTNVSSNSRRGTQRDACQASSVRNLINDADRVRHGDLGRDDFADAYEDDVMGISDNETEAELIMDTKDLRLSDGAAKRETTRDSRNLSKNASNASSDSRADVSR